METKTQQRGYNTMQIALQKAGFETLKKENYKGGENSKNIYAEVVPNLYDKKLETPPTYENKHYDNPILQDAYSYIQVIQAKIDNIEKLENEINNFNSVGYDFFNKDQNEKLSAITMDYLIRERNQMLDNLSSLLYNEKYTPEIHNIKAEVKKTKEIKQKMMEVKKPSSTKEKPKKTKKKRAPKKIYANKLTEVQEKELLELYPTSNLLKMQDKFNCSVYFIKKVLLKNGVTLHNNNKNKK